MSYMVISRPPSIYFCESPDENVVSCRMDGKYRHEIAWTLTFVSIEYISAEIGYHIACEYSGIFTPQSEIELEHVKNLEISYNGQIYTSETLRELYLAFCRENTLKVLEVLP